MNNPPDQNGAHDPNSAPEPGDRRAGLRRRQRIWWSVLYGSFRPRRRQPARRTDEPGYQWLDWHDARLLAVAIGILLLSVADAFMTVTLLANGAVEVNPVMAAVVYQSASLFAVLKMGMTGIGVTFMVFLARYRFMRLVRVEMIMYAMLIGYLALLTYEYGMLREVVDFPLF